MARLNLPTDRKHHCWHGGPFALHPLQLGRPLRCCKCRGEIGVMPHLFKGWGNNCPHTGKCRVL